MSELQKRTLTAIFLVVGLFTIGFIDNYILTWLFLGVVTVLATIEAVKLFQINSVKAPLLYIVAIWFLSYFYSSSIELVFFALVIISSQIAYNKEFDYKNLFPILYPLTPMLFLLHLYTDFGMNSLLWLLVIVAFSDIGAYFVGKKFGKTQFSPTSPKKTLEGVFGGIFFATIAGSYIGIYFLDINALLVVFISLISSIASIFGDLFESYLKRQANIKDSGNILPGHGGVLDRVDGYLFASIVMLIILKGSL